MNQAEATVKGRHVHDAWPVYLRSVSEGHPDKLVDRIFIVDTYGEAAPHGDGTFSGKDTSKVDRSTANSHFGRGGLPFSLDEAR